MSRLTESHTQDAATMSTSTPPRRGGHALMLVFCAFIAIVTSAIVLIGGQYHDTGDPVPPTPGAFAHLEPLPGSLAPLAVPTDRGQPVGDNRENAGLLLLAAASVDAGISPDEPLSGNPQAAEFLWRMLRYVEPYGRFEQTPDGYWLDAFDLEDICREALDCPPGEDPPEGSAFVARDDGYEWQESFCEDWFIDIYTWEPQPDGSVRVCFNVLYDGILFLSFLRQGEAVLLPNEAPVYYHYRLSSLFWNESPKFTPSRVEASSTRPGEDQVSFSPFNLFDNNTATAWAAGIGGEADVEGDVAPPWLLMAFRTPRYVTGFVIVNGWRRDLQSMRMNDRVRLLQIECGALSMEVELEDISDYRIGGDDQSFCFGEAILTEKVTFTVISTYNGIAEDSSVCISEIAFF